MHLTNCTPDEFDELVRYIQEFKDVQVVSTKHHTYRIAPESLCYLPEINQELAAKSANFIGIIWYDLELAGVTPRDFELCYLALGELSARDPGPWCTLYAWMAPISAWLLNNYGWEILGHHAARELAESD